MRRRHLHKHNKRFIAFVAASIDGRISLSRKSLPHWTSQEDWKFLQNALAHSDAVVVGRNTYLAAAGRLRQRQTFVLSSRPQKITRRGNVTFVNPSKVDLAALLVEYDTVAVLGGGAVYRFMLEQGLVDELYVTIEPLIFGRGREMFVGGKQVSHARLLSMERLNRKGTLLLHYMIKHHKR